jgi:hypothetical protein
MVNAINKHSALWTSPAPLWGRFSAEPDSAAAFLAEDQAAPAILRFASDDFMDQLFAMLEADPRQLGELIARPETWRGPSSDAPDLIERVPLPRLARTFARLRKGKAASTGLNPTTHEIVTKENGIIRTLPLKLYHPAHQRHYLVAANLVCGRAGFPDRGVESGGCEQVRFVLRRLFPMDETENSPMEEYAFVKDASGARWQRIEPVSGAVDPAATLAPGEELLPLFPLNFRDDSGHPRRLLAGNVPVGRREEYMSTRKQREISVDGLGGGGVAANPSAMAARKEQLKMEVIEPWKSLIRTSIYAANRIMDPNTGGMDDINTKKEASATSANNQAQVQSWLILLDFADYLYLHVRPVWDCVVDPTKSTTLLTTPAQNKLFNWLNSTDTYRGDSSTWKMSRGSRPFATSLRDALKQVRDAESVRKGLERATQTFPDAPDPSDNSLAWPGFAYLLAGVRGSGSSYSAWGIHSSLITVSDVSVNNDDTDAVSLAPAMSAVMHLAETQVALLDKLVQLVILAIDTTKPAQPAPPLPFAVSLRDALKTTQGDPGWFSMRCVYVRCDCDPQAVLSTATQRFQMANFFDSDAPARPIRITLPLDTTPAGMRKHSKNTAFMISDVLCGQIQRAKGLGLADLVLSVLPWPFHKDLNVGGVGPCQNSGGNIGMICSLSIPIVTICALILLLIIVSLFDFIFKWMPWLIACFPIPGLKAKKDK